MAKPIPVYNALDDKDKEHLLSVIEDAYSKAKPPASAVGIPEEPEEHDLDSADIEISPTTELIGIDPAIYREITAVLRAGKRHILFYGPPGTGKTALAQYVAGVIHSNWTMITGSADWTSQDVIGGYQPDGKGGIKFVPGVLLQNFDRPLIVDELNRCDIDKAIGPLFTVLSDQATTLPYRVDAANDTSPFYRILPRPHPSPAAHEFAPKKGWRLLATINTMDKAALYQMSFALSRRFAWIFVDLPQDLEGFIVEFAKAKGLVPETAEATDSIPLASIWAAVNQERPIGPAPIIDMAKTLRVLDDSIDLFAKPKDSQKAAYLEVVSIFVMPLLDGVSRTGLERILSEVLKAIELPETDEDAQSLKARMVSLAL